MGMAPREKTPGELRHKELLAKQQMRKSGTAQATKPASALERKEEREVTLSKNKTGNALDRLAEKIGARKTSTDSQQSAGGSSVFRKTFAKDGNKADRDLKGNK
jgi:hypothetical protein